MLNGKTIVLGVTGGIAAYKSVEIVSRLVKKGANVFVVMTKNATEFVAPLTFRTMSQNLVTVDMFGELGSWDVEHISLAKRADFFLVAPATANFIGKLANGLADDMLTTTVMATKAPVIIAPAMNTNMYGSDAMKANLEVVRKRGVHIVGPQSGRLACGDEGKGKMSEPHEIVDFLEELVSRSLLLKGKKVLVTAGPTIEPIDPFRYITNHSSGKMGYAIADEAFRMGADVKLVSGPVSIKAAEGIEVVPIKTAEEMYEAVMADIGYDIIIKAAAVSDYRPVSRSEKKIKKGKSETLTIETEKTKDILQAIGDKKDKKTFLVGFAAETEDLERYARRKLISKNLDMIVVNDISLEDSGFKSDYNTVSIMTKRETIHLEKLRKDEVARRILEKIIDDTKDE